MSGPVAGLGEVGARVQPGCWGGSVGHGLALHLGAGLG